MSFKSAEDSVTKKVDQKYPEKYRFPQFNKKGMNKEYILSEDRLNKMDKFVEEFRGWHDDAPNYPPEKKVVPVDEDFYYKEIANS